MRTGEFVMPESLPAHGVMNTRFEREPFSVAEFLAGGIALTTVALIAFIGVRTSQPQYPSPSDPSGSAVAGQGDAAPTTASIEMSPRPLGGGSVFLEWQSFNPGAGPGRPLPAPSNGMATPAALDSPVDSAPAAVVEPTATRSSTTSRDDDTARVLTRGTLSPAEAERNPLNRSDATSIQRRLRDLGYYFGDGHGVWGTASRTALRDFKSMNGLQEDDRWDRETEEQLLSRPSLRAGRTFIGRWALEAGDCRHREASDQLIVNSRGAHAAAGRCDFRSVKQEAAGRWRIRAVCSAAGQAWHANIALTLIGSNLRWSSERGSETYVRCPKR
jgi:hypothetical protein